MLAHGPAAARAAAAAGAHQQALAFREQVRPVADRLPHDDRAAFFEELAWEFYYANRFADAVTAARSAVALREDAKTLVTLARQLYMNAELREARAVIERAVAAAPTDALAATHRAVLLVLTDDEQAALPALAEAAELAAGRDDLIAFGTSYAGLARVQLGDLSGLDLLRDGIEQATAAGQRDYLARSYTSIVRALERIGRYDELAHYVDEGLSRAREVEFLSHAYTLEAHRSLLQMIRGEWATAEQGLRELVGAHPDAGVLARHTLPVLARLLVRRGADDADEWLERAWELARRADVLPVLAPAALATVEHAWLTGRPELADEPVRLLGERLHRPGVERYRGELLRYLRRLGRPAEPFDGCPEEFAAGLRGDWRAAAAAAAVDPYAQALELAESPDADTVLAALAMPRRARRRARGHPRAATAAGARRAADPARADARDAGEPGRAHRAPARRAGPARRGALQPGDRRTAGPLGAHGGPPRVGDPHQARRQLPARGRGPARAVNRPYVLLSVATSLDGHIDDASPERLILSGAEDLDRVDAERAAADAILVGAATIAADDPRLLVRSAARSAERVTRGRPPSPIKVAITRSGRGLDPSAKFFTTGDGEKLVYALVAAPVAPAPPRRRPGRPRSATPPGRARHRGRRARPGRRAGRPRRAGGRPAHGRGRHPHDHGVPHRRAGRRAAGRGRPAGRRRPGGPAPGRSRGRPDGAGRPAPGRRLRAARLPSPAGPDQRHRSRDSPS